MDCRIAGCTDLVKAKGLCNRHYLKLRRYGDPEAAGRRRGQRIPAASVSPPAPIDDPQGAPSRAG